MHSVIIAGGEGSRLWPLSTPEHPKPLLNIFHNKTLLEHTFDRLAGVSDILNIFIVIPASIELQIRAALPKFPSENIIVEPVGRNTAPCIALAAQRIVQSAPEAVMGVFPADHLIANEEHFNKCVLLAEKSALVHDQLVLLGIKPTGPASSYGYISLAKGVDLNGDPPTFFASKFHEKPDCATAKGLLQKGDVLWNSGIYVGRAQCFLDEMQRHAPEIYQGITQNYSNKANLESAYQRLPAISIDYAVTEKLTEFIAVATEIERIDVGNYDTLSELWQRDEQGNAVSGEFVGLNANDNIVFAQDKIVALIGVDNLVVVEGPDAILVCPKSQAAKIKVVQEKWKKGCEK